MFQDLKTQLQAIEGKLRAALEGFESRIVALESEVQTIDAPVAGVFDRFDAAASSVQAQVTSTIGQVRSKIAELKP